MASENYQHPDEGNYTEPVEALRQGLNELPRFSPLLDQAGNVVRVPDSSGRWIEWHAAHSLFDAEMIELLLAKMRARAALSRIKGA